MNTLEKSKWGVISSPLSGPPPAPHDQLDVWERRYLSAVVEVVPDNATAQPRGDIAAIVKDRLLTLVQADGEEINRLDLRDLISRIMNQILPRNPRTVQLPQSLQNEPVISPEVNPDDFVVPKTLNDLVWETSPSIVDKDKIAIGQTIESAVRKVQIELLDRIDTGAAATLSRARLTEEIQPIVSEILKEQQISLNMLERETLMIRLLDDMLGLGPLEPLLQDESVTDILVNGAKQIYVEKAGKLELSEITFRDNAHVMAVSQRIVSAIGRRIDESTPLVDARLADGSRVNIIIPPLAIDGPSLSIRKFAKQKITLEKMEEQKNISASMMKVLKIAARSRLNILISGGTGSGKTTMLNALSRMIDERERIVTIEDAAELQLQQPHVVRLETRSANLEGQGEISMRDLLKNALRMRPDRIILGETRGSEAIDVLQAMNTGHDGSLTTVHANKPREALMRLENMIGMSGINLPAKAVRTQIASAVDLVIQVSRMRDGKRRVTHVTEVVGMEGETILMQDLFTYEFSGENKDGSLIGEFNGTGIRPHFAPRAAYFGLDKLLLEAVDD